MARLIFPNAEDRLVYGPGSNNSPLLSKAGIGVTIYTDAAGTVLANILDLAGAVITGSRLVVDSNSLVPLFQGQDTVTTLYAKADGSPTVVPIYARDADTFARLPTTTRQALSVAGNVNFDLRYGQFYIESLTAAATSSAITGGTAADGKHMTITWSQDATGGRTYVWPTNCRFAGNVAPSDTTASTRTSVSFVYDGTLSKWYEMTRAVAVPN
jgi:hypothetical protein